MKTRCPECREEYDIEKTDVGVVGVCESCKHEFTIQPVLSIRQESAPETRPPVLPPKPPGRFSASRFSDFFSFRLGGIGSTFMGVLFILAICGKAFKIARIVKEQSKATNPYARPGLPNVYEGKLDVEFLSQEVVDTGLGTCELRGAVKNTSSDIMTSLKLSATFFDQNGTVLAYDQIQRPSLASGEVWNFSVRYDKMSAKYRPPKVYGLPPATDRDLNPNKPFTNPGYPYSIPSAPAPTPRSPFRSPLESNQLPPPYRYEIAVTGMQKRPG